MRVQPIGRTMLVGVGLALSVSIAATPRGAAAQSDQAADETVDRTLTLDQVKQMCAAGLGDEVIVAKIEASDAVFNLTVEEILSLKREGVTDRVLASLVRTGVIQKHYGTSSRRAGAPSERHAVSPDVIVERQYPVDVYAPGRYVYRPRYGLSFSYGYPWYGTYVYPSYAYPWYWGGYTGGHYYSGGHHGHHGSSHGGHYGAGGGNHHGGHKPVIGTRTSVGGRGGRR